MGALLGGSSGEVEGNDAARALAEPLASNVILERRLLQCRDIVHYEL